MAKYKFSMKIDQLMVHRNGRSSDKRISNRVLLQLVAPAGTDHPTTTFTFRADDGTVVPTAVLEKALPFALAFKLQDFEQVFSEPLRLRVHFFQDTRRDWFQQLTGRFIELALAAALGGHSIADVKLDKLLSLDESLKLSDGTYSQKLGVYEIDLDPVDLAASSPQQMTYQLTAPETVRHLKMGTAGKKPSWHTVLKKDAPAADLTCTLKLDAV